MHANKEGRIHRKYLKEEGKRDFNTRFAQGNEGNKSNPSA